MHIRHVSGAHVVHGEVAHTIRSPGPLIVAEGAHVHGDIIARGGVHLARGAQVAGSIRAMGEVIVGAQGSVAGDIRAEGRVIVQSGAIVSGEIDAAGDARLAPGSTVARLVVGGDLHVAQPVRAPAVRVKGRTFVEPAS